MNKKLRFSIVLVFIVLFFSFLAGETVVRLIGSSDANGNFYIGSFRLYPYRVPTSQWNSKMDDYLKSSQWNIAYDSVTGWSFQPKTKSDRDGYCYRFNSDGIRTAEMETVISKSPRSGILRIGIFGDSFTCGDNVSYEYTWGHLLENRLKSAGVDVEVLNFGVGAYGMDQSFLRWKNKGSAYDLDIVIFGLQLENINRNGNLARPLYEAQYLCRVGLPFLKPRFILEENELKLINSPTPSPEKTMEISSDFGNWRYSKYEYWYDESKYQDHFFLRSKGVAFFYSLFKERKSRKRILDEERLELLSLEIIKEFKQDVESKGKTFFVVVLPDANHLKYKKIPFVEKIDKEMIVINPFLGLLKESNRSSIKALIPTHYSIKGNEIVANVISEFMLNSDNNWR